MPELPEVETTRRGIAPYLLNRTVDRVVVRQPQLRWPVPGDLSLRLRDQVIKAVERRGKYLLLQLPTGTVLLHLGMSGSLCILNADQPPSKHDHLDIVMDTGHCLRLTDPRRFGAVLWWPAGTTDHPLLRHLGPEPLSAAFSAAHLYRVSRHRRLPVKALLMDSRVVVGVGNIYANEALFMAGIDPRRAAGRIAPHRYGRLAVAVREVLEEAIRQGGTTLRDFVGSDGNPGYFQLYLRVYGRAGEPCRQCDKPLSLVRLAQRATYYCPHCQR